MGDNRTTEIAPSPICLTSYRFEKLWIDVEHFDPSETHNVRLNIEISTSSSSDSGSGSLTHEVTVSASLGPAEEDSHRVDAAIIGNYVSDAPEDETLDSLLSDGAQELYAIMKSTVYSATSGELMLPAITLGKTKDAS